MEDGRDARKGTNMRMLRYRYMGRSVQPTDRDNICIRFFWNNTTMESWAAKAQTRWCLDQYLMETDLYSDCDPQYMWMLTCILGSDGFMVGTPDHTGMGTQHFGRVRQGVEPCSEDSAAVQEGIYPENILLILLLSMPEFQPVYPTRHKCSTYVSCLYSRSRQKWQHRCRMLSTMRYDTAPQ